MSKKKEIWNRIITRLASKVAQSELRTWFSRTSLKMFDLDLAVIEVPNKFVANWIHENYLKEIQNSFEAILNRSPEIHFSYGRPGKTRNSTEPHLAPSIVHAPLNLNPSMTFDRFVQGECNRFAYSSALEVAKGPATLYNPLYVYGDMGLGKTHLLHAIGNYRISNHPFLRIGYLSSDSFTSDFTFSIKNGNLQKFREKYCKLDLLLFDDVHLLMNRKKTQEEFLFLFNSLFADKKQMVISATMPPNRLKNMDPQLASRLGSGLLADIQFPDKNTKIEIIKRKAQEDNIHIPDDVVFFFANANRDIKALINNIVRLETYASLNRGDLNISTVKSFVKNKTMIDIGVEDIKSVAAGYFNIAVDDLISKKKKRAFSYPRQVAMYLSRKYTHLSFHEIGNAFGNKNHSTVIYAIRRIEKNRKQVKEIQDDLRSIENLLE
jgi:chromosomal replication initiator protein